MCVRNIFISVILLTLFSSFTSFAVSDNGIMPLAIGDVVYTAPNGDLANVSTSVGYGIRTEPVVGSNSWSGPNEALTDNVTYTVTLGIVRSSVSSSSNANLNLSGFNKETLIVRTPDGVDHFISTSGGSFTYKPTADARGRWQFTVGGNIFIVPNDNNSPAYIIFSNKVSVTIVEASDATNPPKSDNEALNDIDKGIQEGNQQAQDRFDQEVELGESSGSEASDFASDMESSIRSGWDILWFPITFTQDLLSVFTGGSSAVAYKVDGYKIIGYSYDNSTGNLVPVMERSSPIMPIASSGTSITFPAYTLPGLNVKLWDEYSYDISSLRTDFSAVFTASDTLITMLELYWCIGFLRGKYHDVFD